MERRGCSKERGECEAVSVEYIRKALWSSRKDQPKGKDCVALQ